MNILNHRAPVGAKKEKSCRMIAGNMMTSVLRREEGDNYSLQQFICSNKKETPPENKDLEADFKTFLEKGICMISRTGGTLRIIFMFIQMTLQRTACQ